MTLTKAELADILVEKVSEVSKNDAKEIVARRVVTFHASQKLKGMVEHYYAKQR